MKQSIAVLASMFVTFAFAQPSVEATSKRLAELVAYCEGKLCEAQVHAVEVYWGAVLENHGDTAAAAKFVEQRIRGIKHDFGIR